MYLRKLSSFTLSASVIGVCIFALLPALFAVPDCNSMRPPQPAACGTEVDCPGEPPCIGSQTTQSVNAVLDCVGGSPSQYAYSTGTPVVCTKTYWCTLNIETGGCQTDSTHPVTGSNGQPVVSTKPTSCASDTCNDQS
jgi:hypothetical protein